MDGIGYERWQNIFPETVQLKAEQFEDFMAAESCKMF